MKSSKSEDCHSMRIGHSIMTTSPDTLMYVLESNATVVGVVTVLLQLHPPSGYPVAANPLDAVVSSSTCIKLYFLAHVGQHMLQDPVEDSSGSTDVGCQPDGQTSGEYIPAEMPVLNAPKFGG